MNEKIKQSQEEICQKCHKPMSSHYFTEPSCPVEEIKK